MKKFEVTVAQKSENGKKTNETRRERLIVRRNRRLIARYYYWSELKRLRFDDVLNLLQEEEFFIKERNIMNIINDNNSYLDSLIRNGVTSKQLKKEYPVFNWSMN